MKKTAKIIISLTLSAVLLFGTVMGASAADVAASPEAASSSVGETVAGVLTAAFNVAVDKLLKHIVGFIPDSVRVKNPSEHKTENFYSGSEEFIDEPAAGASWKLGYASASIVPDDFNTGKYYKGGYALNVKLTEVLDDLRVRVIAIDDGSGRGSQIFAVVDCIGLANADVRAIRAELSDFAKANNINSINVSATHVHSGIDTQGIYTDIVKSAVKSLGSAFARVDDYAPAIDQDFFNIIVEKTAECAEKAYANMTEGKLTYAHKNIEPYVRDRTAPDISIDEMYRLMFTPYDGTEPTIIANFGAHPENIGVTENVATADFVYYIEQVINAAGCNFMYIQGAVGTITEDSGLSDDGYCKDRISSTKRYGEELGYILLGMTKTEAECAAEIADPEREALAADCEGYGAWYEDWEPVTEKELEPILNIRIKEFYAPVENGVYELLGKLSLANNEMLRGDDGKFYAVTEAGFMELGKDVKVILCPGETYAELIKGGSNMKNFVYDSAYEIMGTEDVLVFDLMNDAAGYIMPDNYFTYANVDYRGSEGLALSSAWGLTSLGYNAASSIYGEIYGIYDSVK